MLRSSRTVVQCVRQISTTGVQCGPKKVKDRKQPRTCVPDFTKCRGTGVLKGQEDVLLGPDEAYPEWLWNLAEPEMPIDVHLQNPDKYLFERIRNQKKKMNNRIMKLRNLNPEIAHEIKWPTEEEVLDQLREMEKGRPSNWVPKREQTSEETEAEKQHQPKES